MDRAAIRALDAELRSLAHEERRGLVHFLRRLEVLDRERAYAALNCGSAFEYLTRELHMSEGTAWCRVTAMRLIRRFPVIEAALEDGRLNPTQLLVLGPILDAENVDDLVLRATHLSKEKTKELAVSIRPKEVPAEGLRKLPEPAPRPVIPVPATRPFLEDPGGPYPVMGLRIAVSAAEVPLTSQIPPTLVPPLRVQERSRIEPVAAGRWQWRIGLDGARKAKLDRLRDMLSHRIADGDLEKVFDVMLDDALEKEGKKRGYVAPSRERRPAPEPDPTPGKRAPIPLHVRREVLKRDGYQCTFLDDGGVRCPCTKRLEMDHVEPARETGRSGVEDLTTRCRAHNVWRALLRYGRSYVERRILERRAG